MTDHHAADEGLSGWALPGIPEIRPGDDLVALIGDALAAAAQARPERAPQPGDVLVVTSKILSKAEGRVVRAADREDAITRETVREVASRPRADGAGRLRIVENRLGIVGAAAGVDASNTAEGTVLLLPEDPDASAERLRLALTLRFGAALGVIVSDTLGRAWRSGQTDIAIGAAGVRVLHDHRGGTDSYGRPLESTQIAVADELAGFGDLLKGKASGHPVAVIRGAGHLVREGPEAGPGEANGAGSRLGARALVRTGAQDMFRLGTEEAMAEGYRRALAGEPLDS